MKEFEIFFSKEAQKDVKKLTHKQKEKLKNILVNQIAKAPFIGKKLQGNLSGEYSVRLNLHDRIVYSIDIKNKAVQIHRVKTHYGD